MMEGDNDPQTLQKKLNELYQERKDLVTNIKTLVRRKRFINESLKQHSLVGQPSKQNPALQEHQAPKSQESLGQHHPHLNTQEEEIKKVVETHNSIKDRNKRLFGGLNGYLKKAQKRLKEEENKAKQKMSIQENALQKQKDLASKMQEEKLKQLEEQLKRMSEKKQNIEETLIQTENSILKQKFIAYVSDLQHSLTTQQQPSLNWKPANTNPTITQLYQKRQQQLKQHSQQVTNGIVNYREKIDFANYQRQNEKEYHNNLLDQYLKNHFPFAITKTQPKLFWLPAPDSHNKVAQLIKQTKLTLLEQGSKKKQENDQFYLRFQKPVEAEQQAEENESESH